MEFRISPIYVVLCITIALAQFEHSVAHQHHHHHQHQHNSEVLQRNARIINGNEALPGTAKYQVSIRNRINDAVSFGSGQVCSGALISDNVVLTTAKCFVDKEVRDGTYLNDDVFYVVMGSLNRYQKDANTLEFGVKKTVKYMDVFNMLTYVNDLALVFLDGSVPANHPTAQPTRLNGGPINGGTICQLSGWGQTDSASVSDKLLTANLPIISFDDCKQINHGLTLRVGMMCAGYTRGKAGACSGDSGGPLVCNNLHAGIASWSNSCSRANQPNGFTDVAYYKEWILSKVAENKATLPTFVGTITGDGGSTGGGTGSNGGNNGNGSGSGSGSGTGSGSGSGSGSDSGNGDGAMSLYNNSIVILGFALVIVNVIISKF